MKRKPLLPATVIFILLFGIVSFFASGAAYLDLFNKVPPIYSGSAAYGNNVNPYTNQGFFDIMSSVPGRIPILMYHNILTSYWEETRFDVIPEGHKRYFVDSGKLREQLEILYDEGFVNISLDEYLSLMSGETMTLERVAPDKKLYILTFDDATFGQFDFLGYDTNGDPVIDPECAVGIMIDFAKEHPEFKLNAAFSVDFENTPFLDDDSVGLKLNMLLDYGFELVNHTANHKLLGDYIENDPESVAYEIGRAMEYFESYLGYRASTIDKVCYPGGSERDKLYEFVKNVEYNGKVYSFSAALDAEGLQAINPNNPDFNPYDIARIEMNDDSFDSFIINASGLFCTPSLTEKEKENNVMAYLTNDVLEMIP